MLSVVFVQQTGVVLSDSCPRKEEGKGSRAHTEVPQPVDEERLLYGYSPSLQQCGDVPHE